MGRMINDEFIKVIAGFMRGRDKWAGSYPNFKKAVEECGENAALLPVGALGFYNVVDARLWLMKEAGLRLRRLKGRKVNQFEITKLIDEMRA